MNLSAPPVHHVPGTRVTTTEDFAVDDEGVVRAGAEATVLSYADGAYCVEVGVVVVPGVRPDQLTVDGI